MEEAIKTGLSKEIEAIAKKYNGRWDAKTKRWDFPANVAGSAIAEISRVIDNAITTP